MTVHFGKKWIRLMNKFFLSQTMCKSMFQVGNLILMDIKEQQNANHMNMLIISTYEINVSTDPAKF